jgi:hypothetical protein
MLLVERYLYTNISIQWVFRSNYWDLMSIHICLHVFVNILNTCKLFMTFMYDTQSSASNESLSVSAGLERVVSAYFGKCLLVT